MAQNEKKPFLTGNVRISELEGFPGRAPGPSRLRECTRDSSASRRPRLRAAISLDASLHRHTGKEDTLRSSPLCRQDRYGDSRPRWKTFRQDGDPLTTINSNRPPESLRGPFFL